jgi:hypothetical protein
MCEVDYEVANAVANYKYCMALGDLVSFGALGQFWRAQVPSSHHLNIHLNRLLCDRITIHTAQRSKRHACCQETTTAIAEKINSINNGREKV